MLLPVASSIKECHLISCSENGRVEYVGAYPLLYFLVDSVDGSCYAAVDAQGYVRTIPFGLGKAEESGSTVYAVRSLDEVEVCMRFLQNLFEAKLHGNGRI